VTSIGLIAGNGIFPLEFAREARARGYRVAAVAHVGETPDGIAGEVDELVWVRVGQVSRMIRALKRAGVARAVMAGGIDKATSLRAFRPDVRALKLLAKAAGRGDDALLRALADELHGEGIEIVPATELLDHIVARSGPIAGPHPGKRAMADIRLGCRVVAALGHLDVGQGVVVEDGVILAVEAIEGTDEAVRRAGKYSRGSAVVVKMAKPGQDLRFDAPAVGPTTIESMASAGAKVLAVQAQAAILLERQRMAALATSHGISVVGCDPDGEVAGG
jgi:DUF1009 family protein